MQLFWRCVCCWAAALRSKIHNRNPQTRQGLMALLSHPHRKQNIPYRRRSCLPEKIPMRLHRKKVLRDYPPRHYKFRFIELLVRGMTQRPPCLKGAGKLPILGNLTGGYLCFIYPPAPSGHPPLGEGGFYNSSLNWGLEIYFAQKKELTFVSSFLFTFGGSERGSRQVYLLPPPALPHGAGTPHGSGPAASS